MISQNMINISHYGSLVLADGNSWTLGACDEKGSLIAERLSKAMQLNHARIYGQKLLLVRNRKYSDTKVDFLSSVLKTVSLDTRDKATLCQLNPAENKDGLAVQMLKISLFFCSQVEMRGGALVHGGLAEKDGAGIILAGPGEVGKTTACRRLPQPWRSLSDDCTLIVRDKNGVYQAHPWPTWSDFMFDGKGGSWNVQHSIPLKAIFILNQQDKDSVDFIGKGHATCLLNESADQAWLALANDFEDDENRMAMNMQRFNNICEIVHKVPVNILNISLNGSFWEHIDKSLN